MNEALIEQQIQLERDAIKQGLSRLHRNTYNVESKDYASASIYGVASIDSLLHESSMRSKQPRTEYIKDVLALHSVKLPSTWQTSRLMLVCHSIKANI